MIKSYYDNIKVESNVNVKKVGRPRKNEEVRVVKSIRVEPRILKMIESKGSSIQKVVDEYLYGGEFEKNYRDNCSKRNIASSE